MTFTYHILRRLPPKGGSQWYRDKRVRLATTYCGAAPTGYDAEWRSKAPTYVAERSLGWSTESMSYPKVTETRIPCAECLGLRSAERQ